MTKRILVVEDEMDIQRLVKRILTREDFEVVNVASGEEAMEKISSQKFDLVILDINLPGMDGWEVCKKIRKSPIYSDLPILMLTIRSSTNDKIKGFNCGADEYMPKPFSGSELIERIKTLLKRAQTK